MTPDRHDSLLEGLYESLITQELERRLGTQAQRIADRAYVDEGDEPEVLARHVRDAVLRALGSTKDRQARVTLVNSLIEQLGADDERLTSEADYVEHSGERPIAITWRLRTPMPAADFTAASVVAQ